jgi:GAF domain-containing protein
MGNGVCGTAAAEKQTIRVADVDAFPGHIACDAASRSEIVIALVSRKGMLYGVLDLDSPSLNRFDEADQLGLEHVAAVVVSLLEARTGGRDLRSMLI